MREWSIVSKIKKNTDEELETSRFKAGCIPDISDIVHMKILTLMYVHCHFMIILGKAPKFIFELGPV